MKTKIKPGDKFKVTRIATDAEWKNIGLYKEDKNCMVGMTLTCSKVYEDGSICAKEKSPGGWGDYPACICEKVEPNKKKQPNWEARAKVAEAALAKIKELLKEKQ